VLSREVALLALPPYSTRRYPAPLNAFPTCLPPQKGALVSVVDPKKKEGYAEQRSGPVAFRRRSAVKTAFRISLMCPTDDCQSALSLYPRRSGPAH
jgi:hypothetical protein